MIALRFRTLPPLECSQNAKAHSRTEGRARRAWSAELVVEGRDQVPASLRALLPLREAVVDVTAYVKRHAPEDGCYRPLDEPNLIAALKGLYDALTLPRRGRPGLGLIVDDDGAHMHVGDHRIETVDSLSDERLEVVVRSSGGVSRGGLPNGDPV